jgi:hypothetical protein
MVVELQAFFSPTNLHKHISATIPLRIWYGTWNMGGTFAPQTMDHWLFYHLNSSGVTGTSRLADIYVIAVQELVRLFLDFFFLIIQFELRWN